MLFRPDKYEGRIDVCNEQEVLVIRGETHCAISSRSHKKALSVMLSAFLCFFLKPRPFLQNMPQKIASRGKRQNGRRIAKKLFVKS